MALPLVEGWTERIRYQLRADGQVQVLTGISVELILKNRHGHRVTLAGTAAVEDAATGIVYFDPAETDLVSADSPYEATWKATDLSNKHAFYPNGTPELWNVRET